MFKQLRSFKNSSPKEILDFLSNAHDLKKQALKSSWSSLEFKKPKLITQIFFEPSTRTRVSFELAAHRLNLKFSHFQMDETTSLAKGETIYDSLKVFEGLKPDLIIYRSKSDEGLNRFFNETQIPFVCAGLGHEFHPTQALLDIFTIQEAINEHILKITDLKNLKILFVGDTKNSRVVGSHVELSKVLGYQIFQCSDHNHGHQDIQNFNSLAEAIESVDIVMRLRTQKERGSKGLTEDYKITDKHLSANNILLMHPGPFLRGEDFDVNLPEHKKSLIWKQKENGLYVRAMIYKKIWSET